MENKERYNHLNEYYKNKFGERTLKICIDAGFTCPNRDGTLSSSGCIFCSEKGAGELIKFSKLHISEQVNNFLNSYRGMRANKFIVYFQNFTNTYDSLENLKEKYDAALVSDKIVGISIATRPDCITEDIAKLIASYADKYDVSVELGLQTSNDNIGRIINRYYTTTQFTTAVNILRKYNIEIITHMMIGLPKESFVDIKDTVKFINNHDIQGLKIHSTYIVKNTVLASMYYNKEYEPITLDYYLDALTYVITHVRPDLIIHRISGDAPKDLLVAPKWNLHKKWILNGFAKRLKDENLWQGKFYDCNINL
ncbi:MAG: TIGR01212 family radical SAM protein [Clostridia bacterium]|jgi:radical SAM protein (TIGR01212 family)|nr:TIGR01212 family radical SAM protein [Clostridium sp.]MBS5863678.1 TIGR01212 family radical SAM protein [Clostridium sp.]MEE0269574.1 TIGR01212 family radical SAM protein [Clostridia bacterium]